MKAHQHRKSTAPASLLGCGASLVVGIGLMAALTERSPASLVGSVLSGIAAGFGAMPVPLLLVAAAAAILSLWLRWR